METAEFEEKDGNIDKPTQWAKAPKVHVTTTIDPIVWQEAKNSGISWSNALEFGLKFLIADAEGVDYPDCNLQDKLYKTVKHRNALMLEVDALRKQIPEVEDEEVDEILNAEVKKDE